MRYCVAVIIVAGAAIAVAIPIDAVAIPIDTLAVWMDKGVCVFPYGAYSGYPYII